MKSQIIVLILFCLLNQLNAEESLFKIPSDGQTLQQKLSRAASAASTHPVRSGYWIGYSIQRLMDSQQFLMDGDNLMFGYMNFHSSRPTLEEMLSGRKLDDPADVRKRAADLLNEGKKESVRNGIKTFREIAVLLQFKGDSTPVRYSAMSMNLPFEQKGLPLYWLGSISDEESFAYLTTRYSKISVAKMKESLISLIALHQTQGLAFPFLRDVLQKEAEEKLRERAVFGLGHQASEEAFSLLLQTVQNDSSEDVRQSAIWGIAEMKSEASSRAIVGFARSHPSRDIRRTAICALEELDSSDALPVLAEISWSDPDEEFREAAMATLADLPDGKGVDTLIKILENHPSKESRKAAIWMLQDTEDPRARKALAKIVNQ